MLLQLIELEHVHEVRAEWQYDPQSDVRRYPLIDRDEPGERESKLQVLLLNLSTLDHS